MSARGKCVSPRARERASLRAMPFALLLVVLVPSTSRAQQSIPRYTIDGGGGSSSGGSFVLAGTAGQPDAGLMTGGSFSLAGGFWFGGAAASGVQSPISAEHLETRLNSIAPNPGRGPFELAFSLARPEVVRMELMDVAGRRVRTLVDEPRIAGHHTVTWNGRDDQGRQLSNGVYLLRFAAGSYLARQKVLVLR